MSANLREWYTLEEYFALEQASERRFEYRDGDIVCMSGASREHIQISTNLTLTIGVQLKGKTCRVYGSDCAVVVPKAPPIGILMRVSCVGSRSFKNSARWML